MQHRSRLAHAALIAMLGVAVVPAATAASGAGVFVEHLTIPLDGEIVEGCTEPILLSGSLRDVLVIVEQPNGGVTIHVTTSPSGVSGIGLESGAMYRVVGATTNGGHNSFDYGFGSGVATGTLVDRTRFVGTAGAETLDIRTTFHLTKIDGVNSVIFERTSITCS